MVIYFGILILLFFWHGFSLWKARDGGGLLALLSVTVLSALVGAYYYIIH